MAVAAAASKSAKFVIKHRKTIAAGLTYLATAAKKVKKRRKKAKARKAKGRRKKRA